jgi:hypothetical protein
MKLRETDIFVVGFSVFVKDVDSLGLVIQVQTVCQMEVNAFVEASTTAIAACWSDRALYRLNRLR